jgi:hypothetical protein
MIKKFHFKDATMIQHIEINKQNQGPKLHEHLSGCRKSPSGRQHPLMINSLKKLGIE